MIDQIYQLLKTDPAYSWMSDKEKFIYLQLSEIHGEKTNAELCQICGQRASMLNKFVTKLREKKLYPIPVIKVQNPVQKMIHEYPKEQFIQRSPIPMGPICEVCGLEGKVAAQRGRPVMHGIELFQEDGRILCATCRLKGISPKHGAEEQIQAEDEEDEDV